MTNSKEYKKIEIECSLCKAKFDIWISINEYTPEMEETIKQHLYNYCPVCKALEELKNKSR